MVPYDLLKTCLMVSKAAKVQEFSGYNRYDVMCKMFSERSRKKIAFYLSQNATLIVITTDRIFCESRYRSTTQVYPFCQ